MRARAREREKVVLHWKSEMTEFHTAEMPVRDGILYLTAESLGEAGWDWRVWDERQRAPQRYGLGDTLEEAKARAERALIDLMQQIGQAA